MAQSKSFFGLRRGSTKSLTFSTFNGKQVTKDRVTDVKNPRTQDQMINRMINYTVMKAYSGMKEIVDHSFASKSYGLQSMRYFLSKNYALLKANKEESGFSTYKGGIVPNSYLVSEGALPVIGYSLNTGNVEIKINGTTIKNLKETLGLAAGDYFTFVWLDLAEGKGLNWIRCYLPSDEMDEQDVTIGSLEIEKNVYGLGNVTIEEDGPNAKKIVLSKITNTYVYGTIIASSKKSDKWQRSTNYLASWGDETYENYEEALNTYPIGASYILNGGSL